MSDHPNNVELLWNLAREYHHAANKEDSKEAQLNDYLECQDYAKKSIQLDDNSAPAHFWLGICYGKEARLKGMFAGLSLSDKIKKEMERVVELDPVYNDAGGHRALGRLLFKLPKLMGGDLEKARSHLEEAVRIAPHFSTNHLYLAEVYLRTKEFDLAYKELKVLEELPLKAEGEETVREEKEKVRKLMRDIPPGIKKKGKSEFSNDKEEEKEMFEREAGYFEKNKERMRYHAFRKQGLFVGSGVLEAGCRTVIGQRLKQSGMHWTAKGANN